MSSVGTEAEMIIDACRGIRMIYSELIEPHALGNPTIVRGACVEPDQNGFWWADMSPVSGPRQGPYLMRS